MKYSIRRQTREWYYLTIPADCRITILPRPVSAGPGAGGSMYQIRVYRGAGTKKCLGQFFGTEVMAVDEGIEVDRKHPLNMADKLTEPRAYDGGMAQAGPGIKRRSPY